jgi:hypothetical protein
MKFTKHLLKEYKEGEERSRPWNLIFFPALSQQQDLISRRIDDGTTYKNILFIWFSLLCVSVPPW